MSERMIIDALPVRNNILLGIMEQVRKAVLPDFLKLCRGEEVKLNLE